MGSRVESLSCRCDDVGNAMDVTGRGRGRGEGER